jgi:hypothetical protein
MNGLSMKGTKSAGLMVAFTVAESWGIRFGKVFDIARASCAELPLLSSPFAGVTA